MGVKVALDLVDFDPEEDLKSNVESYIESQITTQNSDKSQARRDQNRREAFHSKSAKKE